MRRQLGRSDRRRALAGVVSALTLASVLVLPGLAAAAFEPVRVPGLYGKKLFDLGTTDLDHDGTLDIFSVNHKYPASALLNEGDFRFRDGTAELGLSHAAQFPGLERLDQPPALERRGLYAYFRPARGRRGGSLLRLRSKGEPAAGTIRFASRLVNFERARAATYSLSDTPTGSKRLQFELEPGGEVAFRVIYADLPMRFRIRRPADVFVGSEAVPARSSRFEVRIPDRHGYVFAPLDDAAPSDLYIVGGGLNGAASDPGYATLVADEALLSGERGLRPARPFPLPPKHSCRGRAGAAADADGDGDIDLFASCDGGPPLLALRNSGGSFSPGPPLPQIPDAYRWIDAGGDPGAELVTAKDSTIAVWRLRDGRWSLLQALAANAPADRPVQSFASADIDGDRDLDLLALSGGGNTLLLRSGGQLLSVPPERLGLPAASVAAAFADVDNDGDSDAHFVPQGLLTNEAGTYAESGRLRLKRPYAISSWPDLDLDGRRDLLVASGAGPFDPTMNKVVLRNRERAGHWLEVDLRGPAANPDGIGAVVELEAGGRTVRQWVGQNEGSRYSQGHYRTYFGLGPAARVGRLVVRWPDGSVSARNRLAADRLVSIEHR